MGFQLFLKQANCHEALTCFENVWYEGIFSRTALKTMNVSLGALLISEAMEHLRL